ncbi:hypothetical protein ACFE04_021663 [Oxalis oulophora]
MTSWHRRFHDRGSQRSTPKATAGLRSTSRFQGRDRCRRIDDVVTSLGEIGVDPEIDVVTKGPILRTNTGLGMLIPRDADLDVELINVMMKPELTAPRPTGPRSKDAETRNAKLGGNRSHAVNQGCRTGARQWLTGGVKPEIKVVAHLLTPMSFPSRSPQERRSRKAQETTRSNGNNIKE